MIEPSLLLDESTTVNDQPKLFESYRATTYWATPQDGQPWQVRVDDLSPLIGPMAFITAYNPASEQRTPAENKRRTQNLKQDLLHHSYDFWSGHTTADDGVWPREDGFWIRPLSREAAIALGRDYGQNAILFIAPASRDVELLDTRKFSDKS